MKTISEPARLTPVTGEFDVLVCGAGPAGFAAAVCAAREGAKTCLVEQTGLVGGVATSGLMSHWTGNTRGGFYEELLDRSCDPAHPEMRQTINPDRLQQTMLDMLAEAGVELRLYTFTVGPVTENGTVAGAITESKSGREAVLAKAVVDATASGASSGPDGRASSRVRRRCRRRPCGCRKCAGMAGAGPERVF